eukprot:1296787-Lingulodinium_polyedra.AAC.1
MPRARPATHAGYAIGGSQIGRRCVGSASSPPGFGSRRPTGWASGHAPASSTVSSTTHGSSSS